MTGGDRLEQNTQAWFDDGSPTSPGLAPICSDLPEPSQTKVNSGIGVESAIERNRGKSWIKMLRNEPQLMGQKSGRTATWRASSTRLPRATLFA